MRCNLKLGANIGFILKFIHLQLLLSIMKHFHYTLLALFVLFASGCKKDTQKKTLTHTATVNSIKHAKGLELYRYDGFTVVKVTNPWPEATDDFTYVMHKEGVAVPDSLKQYTAVQVPL